MSDQVQVTFRGIETRQDLVLLAQKWSATIRAGFRTQSVDAQVVIHRCAPQWGASTTVQVALTIDGQQITQYTRCQDPHDAVQGSFTAIAKRLRPASRNGGPVVMQSSIEGSLHDGSEEPGHPF